MAKSKSLNKRYTYAKYSIYISSIFLFSPPILITSQFEKSQVLCLNYFSYVFIIKAMMAISLIPLLFPRRVDIIVRPVI